MTAPAAAVSPLRSVSRIMVVDDDERILRLTRRILERHGYVVLTAGNGAAALEIARLAMMRPGTAIHLVLTDIEMPGVDGYALGRRLALTWPAISVVYMSGSAREDAGPAPRALGDQFIAKPFSESHLLLKLALAMRLARRRADTSLSESREDPAALGREAVAAAAAARAAVAYLDDEGRWALLQRWLEEEGADRRNSGRRSLRLEALRSIVSPYVSDRKWDEVVREHWPVRWADQLRLANALGCARPEAVPAGITQRARA